MTTAYAPPFTGSETLSPTEHRTLAAGLGAGLLLTVIALAWGGIAARLEPSTASVGPRDGAAELLQSDAPHALLVVETATPPWILEEPSL